MEEVKLMDAVERYIRGEMNPDERLYFENLRKTSPEVDQLVVEHTLFLQQMNRFGEWKKFRTLLHDVHTDLAEQGRIQSARLKGRAKVVYLWKRSRKVVAIAAVIAGVTTLGITALVNTFSPKVDKARITQLDREIDQIKHKQNQQGREVNNLKSQMNDNAPAISFRAGGTGFLVDAKGYLVTNAHIIRNSRNIQVSNSRGDSYRAVVVRLIPAKDIAILKIDDPAYKAMNALPYAIRKGGIEVAEPVFTLGFPGNQIVYTEGYLSARTGLDGDTLNCQLGIDANRGNSGGPVFNKDGEIIGVISSRENDSEGIAFAVQSRYVLSALEDLKKEEPAAGLRIPSRSSLRGLSKQQQVKKIQEFIFMVRAD